MLFNSIDFAIFLPIVFLLYWFVGRHNLWRQNAIILVASYIFYGWWDWRFLSLIAFSTLVDYGVGRGLGIYNDPKLRKCLLATSLVANLGLLGFFKYYNFFLDNLESAFTFFGADLALERLTIILPVGISFYTFQTLSYTIDVYRRNLPPTKDLLGFASFVSFFPQLVAGPIERASNLLPQFHKARNFNYPKSVDGLRQMLWGFFKKIVIADNSAEIVNHVFAHSDQLDGSTLLFGAIFFAFQIYGDFSGYSDIAIGTSRLFGVDLMQNFKYPYFSRDIAEFWRRWHISLSTWFRDYLYIPLGGSRGSKWLVIRNIIIVFVVSGCWHGANWTFIVWGLLNALFFLPLLLMKRHRVHLDTVAAGRLFPQGKEVVMMLGTFALTTISWIFFRAESIDHAFRYIVALLSPSLFTIPTFHDKGLAYTSMLLILFLVAVEWNGRTSKHALETVGKAQHWYIRWFVYAMLLFMIGLFMPSTETPFIYFQF